MTKYNTDAENPTATRDGWVVYSYANQAGEFSIGKIRQDGSEATRLVAGGDQSEVSPDGEYVAQPLHGQYAAQPFLRGLRVVRLADGVVEPFRVQRAGRCRWMPDGRAIAFTGIDEKGVQGVFVQDFVPGQDTRKTRRRLGGFDPDLQTESFGISPDGSRMTFASSELISSLMVADRVPGVSPPRLRVP